MDEDEIDFLVGELMEATLAGLDPRSVQAWYEGDLPKRAKPHDGSDGADATARSEVW
jgi:hypothetical protein